VTVLRDLPRSRALAVLACFAALLASGSGTATGEEPTGDRRCASGGHPPLTSARFGPADQRPGGRLESALRRREGTKGYTDRELRGIDLTLARALDRRAASTTRRVLAIRVPVHAHVMDGPRYRGPSKAKVLAQVAILNRAFSGQQSLVSAAAGVSFVLRSFQRVNNRGWLEAAPGSTADRTMRRRLHRGGKASLNAYFAAPPGGFLGSSSFPWDVARRPGQDGVTIHSESMTGGRLRGYDQGDTAVHEVGHWLGLLHTFEGGCSVRHTRRAGAELRVRDRPRHVRGRGPRSGPQLHGLLIRLVHGHLHRGTGRSSRR